MSENATNLALDGSVALVPDGPAPLVPVLTDRRQRWRRCGAISAAVMLHGAVLLLFLIRLPIEPPPEPPIPVEIVQALPPKPKAQPATPQPPAPAPLNRESGGDPDHTMGKAPNSTDQAKVKPEPTPAAPAPVTLPKTDEAAPVARENLTPLPIAPPVPPPLKPSPESRDVSERPGEGGGDRYLNQVRDDILRHHLYPAAARALGLTGTAIYNLIVNRAGELLQVSLVHSTGYHELDDAGLRMIELSVPLRPIPADVPGERVGLVLTLFMGP